MLAVCINVHSQPADIVVLNKKELSRLRKEISANAVVRSQYDSIRQLAEKALGHSPSPLPSIRFEGLLETDPARIETVRSLEDIDYLENLVYAWYGQENRAYAEKAKEIILAWSGVYKTDGNPINENKLTVVFRAFCLFENLFSAAEKKKIISWMESIAKAEMNRKSTPNNNWEAKRLKVIGVIGTAANNKGMVDYAIKGFKKYIETSFYPDGTSNDLKDRDALHYHVSGVKPLVAFFVNHGTIGRNLYSYVSPAGSSTAKSVEYVVPFATGEKKREEWKNSKSAIDRERAAAGLEEYKPGKLYNPAEAVPLFEWASFFNPEWFSIVGKGKDGGRFTATWTGFLNSPVIRR